MTRLNLSPLPSLRPDELPIAPGASEESFVDDSAVLSLIIGPTLTREIPDLGDLALASTDMDFAGWSLPTAPFSRNAQPRTSATAPPPAPLRRAEPPVQDEPGLGKPHRGNHRWWLAGLAGATTTLLCSLLLLSLSSRLSINLPENVIPTQMHKPRSASVAVPPVRFESRSQASQLTDASYTLPNPAPTVAGD